jgi:hypothetical protein
MENWKPIETVPTDGRKIWIKKTVSDEEIVTAPDENGNWMDFQHHDLVYITQDEYMEDYPTHWADENEFRPTP